MTEESAGALSETQRILSKIDDMSRAWGSGEIDADYEHAPAEAYEAWRDLKFGMRIHWGIYSTLGVDASWPIARGNGNSDEFRKLYLTQWQVFNPTEFDAEEWGDLAERAGMKYFVFTSKHPDSFCMYDTKTTVQAFRRPYGVSTRDGMVYETCMMHFSIMDTLFKRDIVKEVVDAFRKRGMGIGLYYTNMDWSDPNFRWDELNMFYDPDYGPDTHPEDWQAFINRQREQVREICTMFGKLDMLALDCRWPEEAYGELIGIVKLARSLQPDVLFRHRGIGPYGDYQTPEHWLPDGPDDPRLDKAWQAIEHLGVRWAYQANDQYKSGDWIVESLLDSCSKGGNFMVGVSPMANGRFPQETIERLEYAGDWLKVNGEGIYGTRAYRTWGEGDHVRYTRTKDGKIVYAFIQHWPETTFGGGPVRLEAVRAKPGSAITMLGLDHQFAYAQDEHALTIEIPAWFLDPDNRPCTTAYAFRIEVADA